MTSSNGNPFRVTGPMNSPHKGQWRGALMFSLICVWINGWVNNREAGDLRRHRGHCDVNVMQCKDAVLPVLKFPWESTYTWKHHLHIQTRLWLFYNTSQELCTQFALYCILIWFINGWFNPNPPGLHRWYWDSDPVLIDIGWYFS